MLYIMVALIIGLVFLLFVAAWKLALRQDRQCSALIKDWASENGFRIIERTYEQFWHGPFWWRFWHTDFAVYRVVVENLDGNRLTAHVRISGWFRPTDLVVEWTKWGQA